MNIPAVLYLYRNVNKVDKRFVYGKMNPNKETSL